MHALAGCQHGRAQLCKCGGARHEFVCWLCCLQGIIDYGDAHKHITATLKTLISQVSRHEQRCILCVSSVECKMTPYESAHHTSSLSAQGQFAGCHE
jgi:hypothetical protein